MLEELVNKKVKIQVLFSQSMGMAYSGNPAFNLVPRIYEGKVLAVDDNYVKLDCESCKVSVYFSLVCSSKSKVYEDCKGLVYLNRQYISEILVME